jgi:hypothetical protein
MRQDRWKSVSLPEFLSGYDLEPEAEYDSRVRPVV